MNRIVRSPFGLLNELQREMNHLFDTRVQDNGRTLGQPGDWVPAVDIHEDDQSYHLAIDLPGINRDDIEITAHDGVLSIRGQRNSVHEDKEQRRNERIFGAFVREFSMPENADLENIQAKCQDGVLAVVVPKVPRPEPRRIAIQ